MMYDHHNFSLNFTKSVLKGAVIGSATALTTCAIGRKQPMYWKKIRMFAMTSRTNEAKMIWAVNRNFILVGSMISAS